MTTKAENLANLASAFLGNAANQSLGANGFAKLPNDMIIQWGQITVPGSGATSGNQLVPLPTPFSTGAYVVLPISQNVATPARGPAFGWLPNSAADFSLRWSCNAGELGGGTVLSYIAIGK